MDLFDPSHIGQNRQLVNASANALEFVGDFFQPINHYDTMLQSGRTDIGSYGHMSCFCFEPDFFVLLRRKTERDAFFLFLFH